MKNKKYLFVVIIVLFIVAIAFTVLKKESIFYFIFKTSNIFVPIHPNAKNVKEMITNSRYKRMFIYEMNLKYLSTDVLDFYEKEFLKNNFSAFYSKSMTYAKREWEFTSSKPDGNINFATLDAFWLDEKNRKISWLQLSYQGDISKISGDSDLITKQLVVCQVKKLNEKEIEKIKKSQIISPLDFHS